MDIKLNLGCSIFKIPELINIDIDPSVNPDICMDILKINEHYEPNSVDYIQAGHFFEHLSYEDSLEILTLCRVILKPFRMICVTVPDYTKCQNLDIEMAEKVIMGQGEHKILMNKDRLSEMFKKSGFSHYFEIQDLTKVPYLLVSDINNPKPDIWQTSFIGFKK